MSESRLMPEPHGRRERTRLRLLQAAAELTVEKGVGMFTMEDVAQRAEVHVQTLYKHFPSKNDLLKGSATVAVAELEDALKRRGPDEMTIEIWRSFVAKYAAQFDKPANKSNFVLPEKSTAHWYVQARFIEVLTHGLAADMGVDPRKDRRPYLMAILLRDANDMAFMEWVAGGSKKKLTTMLVGIIDEIRDHYFVDGRPGKVLG